MQMKKKTVTRTHVRDSIRKWRVSSLENEVLIIKSGLGQPFYVIFPDRV